MFGKIKAFFVESKQEFKRVNWPTLPEATRLTLIVVVFALFIALFLGILDAFFTFSLSQIF